LRTLALPSRILACFQKQGAGGATSSLTLARSSSSPACRLDVLRGSEVHFPPISFSSWYLHRKVHRGAGFKVIPYRPMYSCREDSILIYFVVFFSLSAPYTRFFVATLQAYPPPPSIPYFKGIKIANAVERLEKTLKG